MEKVNEGGVEVPNPFNRQTYHVPLEPEKVSAFVFWSKNFRPFLPYLPQLEESGFERFIFNFTITGLPKVFEPNIPSAEETIRDFITLSRHYGRKQIFWRFDPILFSDVTNEDYYINRFTELADKIAPFTERCIFSFAFFYNKVKRSLAALKTKSGITTYDAGVERKRALAGKLAELASAFGLEFHACCCEYLAGVPGVQRSRCVDGELVSKLTGGQLKYQVKPSREGCGCSESTDIGQYNTCKGGCVYCYAR